MVEAPDYDDGHWEDFDDELDSETDEDEEVFEDDDLEDKAPSDHTDPESHCEEELEALEQEYADGLIDEEEYEERHMRIEDKLRRHQWNEEVLDFDNELE